MLVSFNDDLLARFDARPEQLAPARAELQALQSRIEGFSVVAKREGLLSLDDEIDWITDPLLRIGLRALVDGVLTVEELGDWLLTLLVSEARTGLPLVRQLIISEGLLAIWKGDDPELGRLLVEAYLGRTQGGAP